MKTRGDWNRLLQGLHGEREIQNSREGREGGCGSKMTGI